MKSLESFIYSYGPLVALSWGALPSWSGQNDDVQRGGVDVQRVEVDELP